MFSRACIVEDFCESSSQSAFSMLEKKFKHISFLSEILMI